MNNSNRLLYDICNYGYINTLNGIKALFFKRQVLENNINKFFENKSLNTDQHQLEKEEVVIKIKPYNLKHPAINKIVSSLKEIESQIAFALVHGSYGSEDAIPYSDFDGLIVLKNETVSDPQILLNASRQIQSTLKNIFEIDPLQHHGWFVCNEDDFNNYKESFLPVATLQHSKSLLNTNEIEIKLHLIKETNFDLNFLKLYTAIRTRLSTGNYPKNLYSLKSLLSEFMLMPALYYQAKYKKGIYKGDSFGVLSSEFESNSYQIMNEVSLIRKNWSDYIDRNKIQYKLSNTVIRRLIIKKFGGKIPDTLKNKLDSAFYDRMIHLIDLMKINLDINNSSSI